ncbi:MAG: DUF4331 family protein [Deltaproteobacteria bacterium]|nr:DUF4331 family protein [Deltaproteobacteria bacterium]
MRCSSPSPRRTSGTARPPPTTSRTSAASSWCRRSRPTPRPCTARRPAARRRATWPRPHRHAPVANDMFALITGAPGLIRGVPTAASRRPTCCASTCARPRRSSPTTAGRPTLPAGTSALGAAGGDLNGFPNGRRLFDDVVDIELRYVLNSLPNINAIPFATASTATTSGSPTPSRTWRSPAPAASPRTQRIEPPAPRDALGTRRPA